MRGMSYEKLLAEIRDEQLEDLFLQFFVFEEQRICELVKELKGNKSVKRVIVNHCGLGPSFAAVLHDVLEVNTSVTRIDLCDNNLGSEGARAIAEALKVNKSVKWLTLYRNGLGTEGAQAIGEALKVNYSLKNVDISINGIDEEGTRALLDVLQVNGSLIDFYLDGVQSQVNDFCKRNFTMHKRARESVIYFLMLRKMRRIIWIPKEITMMIGQMLWRTKCDVSAWN